MIDFSGKHCVVTGSQGGIGAAAMALFAELGGVTHGLDLPDADVRHRAQVDAAFAALPQVDVAVANAGLGTFAPLEDTSEDHWQRTLDVNLKGVFHTVRAAARRMRGRGGSIVVTASTNSYDGEAGLVAYNASKAGVLGIVHTAANELAPHGIRVNAVCPGLIRTPLTRSMFDDPAYLREYFRHIPLGRGGDPAEVARAIAFLASDAASYITGAELRVDGGQLACKYSGWKEDTATFDGQRWRLL